MIETQPNLVAASSCGAASVSTPLSQEATAAAVAVRITDVLVTSLDPAGLAALAGLAHACSTSTCRPRRSHPTAGYATASAQLASVVAAKTAKSSSSAKSSTSKSSTSKTSSSTSSKTSGPLGFLNDPKMSVEDKLFKFMCYVADRYDKAIEKKMNEIANKQATSSKSSSGSKKGGGGGLLGGLLGGGGGGGLLGGILGGGGGVGGILGTLCPAAGIALDLLKDTGAQDLVTQLSGPVLAAGASCLGFPEFAPLLLRAGPELTQGAFGLLESATGSSSGGSGSSTKTAASSSSGTSSTDGEPKIEQKDMLELQRLQDKQKEMFSLVSNMLRSMHDTKMAVINNLRT
jgi:hypothetical protein